MDTEARLHRLEKRSRWFTWALIGVGVVLLAQGMEGLSRAGIPSTLRTKRLEIVNDEGVNVVTVGAKGEGDGFLFLQRTAGSGSLFADPEGVSLYNRGGHLAARLGLDAQGRSTLRVDSEEADGGFFLGFDREEGTPLLGILWEGQQRILMGASAIRTPLIALKSAEGVYLVTLSATPQEGGHLQVTDRYGRHARTLAPVGYGPLWQGIPSDKGERP